MNPIRRCAVHALQSGFAEHFLSVGETPAVGWLIGPERSHSFKPRTYDADPLPHNNIQMLRVEPSLPRDARFAPLLPKEITIPLKSRPPLSPMSQ
jgi:hypothetical protein